MRETFDAAKPEYVLNVFVTFLSESDVYRTFSRTVKTTFFQRFDYFECNRPCVGGLHLATSIDRRVSHIHKSPRSVFIRFIMRFSKVLMKGFDEFV